MRLLSALSTASVTCRPLTLAQAYRQYLAEHDFHSDPAQEALVTQLQTLLDRLVLNDQPLGLLSKLRRYFARHLTWRLAQRPHSADRIKGLYVWGDVGRGKTLLLNLFFRHLPIRHKTRLHFHAFMRDTHERLAQLKNTRDPLAELGRRWAKNTRLLYLDEFQVIDITDAMILGELLKQLIRQGVVMVMSSNAAPQTLYQNGLQRQRFLPAIDLIERHFEVFELKARCDYRLRLLSQTTLYNTPADARAQQIMSDSFRNLATDDVEENTPLNINGHSIPTRRRAGGVIWFDFDAICGGPRSAADYLEIAHCHETVLVSGVPLFEGQDDLARRFINMIDAFYDRRVRLIVSAAAAPDRLYRRGRLAQAFDRTASRLVEMSSANYIMQAHDDRLSQ